MSRRLLPLVLTLGLTVFWTTLPRMADATTAGQVCATVGNSCAAGVANINVTTTLTCDSELDFVTAGFPVVRINDNAGLVMEQGSLCSLTLDVQDLLINAGGKIIVDKPNSKSPGKVTVNASGTITTNTNTLISVIGGSGDPHPTIELFAGGNVTLAGKLEARGTSAIGFGGQVIIESEAGKVVVQGSATIKASSTDPGGTLVRIKACDGIEIKGTVNATAKKRSAEIELFSRETILIDGGDLIADVRIAELHSGDTHRITVEARDDIVLKSGAVVSANSKSTNKVAGAVTMLSTEGALTCTSSTITANALGGGSDGGLLSLRSFDNLTYNCTLQAKGGTANNGQGGAVLLQSFQGDVLGTGNVQATAKLPGSISLAACANPITDGGTFNPAAGANPGVCVVAPTTGVNFINGIEPCGTQPPPPNNQCPAITILGGANQSVQSGQTIAFDVSATDPDNGTVTLSASNLPANATFTPNPTSGAPTATGQFSFSPTPAQENQSFSITFTAGDNQGCGGVQAAVQITVTTAPPVCQASTASSLAFGESTDLTLVPLLGANLQVMSGPMPVSSGSAPPAYSDADSQGSVSVTNPQLGTPLTTGLLETAASSTVPGSDTASAEARVANPNLSLLTLLGLTATKVESTADIAGVCGTSLTATGTTTVVDGATSGILGQGFTIPPNPAPNTVLLDQLGVKVILNEQIVGGNGVNSRSLTVNAIHVDINNTLLSLIGVLSGDFIIGQSQAQVQCVCP